jgi:hypothetical protein
MYVASPSGASSGSSYSRTSRASRATSSTVTWSVSWVSGTTSGLEPLTDGTPSKPLGIAGSANRAASTTCRAEERSGNPTLTCLPRERCQSMKIRNRTRRTAGIGRSSSLRSRMTRPGSSASNGKSSRHPPSHPPERPMVLRHSSMRANGKDQVGQYGSRRGLPVACWVACSLRAASPVAVRPRTQPANNTLNLLMTAVV